MYFYALGAVAHVVGEVAEPSEGMLPAEQRSTDTRGPTNTVVGECTVNGNALTGLISVNAVVQATGP